MIRVAINGLGRIGRSTFKLLMNDTDVEIIAVNDFASPYQIAYLLNFDTVYGKLNKKVTYDDYCLYVDGRAIRVFNNPEPVNLPWREMNIDVLVECTGKFTKREELQKHVMAGAKKVILSCPSESEEIPTIVNGVNNNHDSNLEIVSCASATTNCIAPVLEILNRRIGVKKALTTTIHSYTPKQAPFDKLDNDLRKGRSITNNFIPMPTKASRTTPKVLPELKNKFEGISIVGPTPVGSLADITIVTHRHTSVEEINRIFSEEAGSERYLNILGVNNEPIVSSDIMLDPRASVVDLTLTQVVDGDLVKVLSWYDNEWGYVNQLVKELKRIGHRHEHYQNQNDSTEILLS